MATESTEQHINIKAAAKYWAIVPAAGAGRRMGAGVPKQYLQLGAQTVLEHTLDRLLDCERIAGIVLVLSPVDEFWPGLRGRYADCHIEIVTGGAERCHSVLKGLDHLVAAASANDWVLVHDAARPCVRVTDIERLMDDLADGEQGGLLGVPVADTMKRVDGELQVTATIERAGLWHALTPQMFRIGALRTALQQAVSTGCLVTDEAGAMELAGHRPRMVAGHRDNIKITLPADLALAAFYLQTEQQQ
jgi:2-C-methyl-D-erythritol 4-phosphate cytidylyltransferase